jgi:MFS family permease
MVGVILPVLNAFLKEANWSCDSIGYATAAAGLGTLLFQTPAGWLTDNLTRRRALFAAMAAITDACLVVLPFAPKTPAWVDSLLFALALGLAGHRCSTARWAWSRRYPRS